MIVLSKDFQLHQVQTCKEKDVIVTVSTLKMIIFQVFYSSYKQQFANTVHAIFKII